MRTSFKIFINLVIFICFTCYFFYVVLKCKTDLSYFSFIKSEISLNNTDLNQTYVNRNTSKVFCILLSSKKNFKTKAKSVYEIWAHKCDNFKFISLIPDELEKLNKSKNSEYDPIYLNSWIQPEGLVEDSYEILTTKVFLAYKHIYKLYPNYDWYLKADDDTFIFVDNLRKFIADKNSSSPVTYGYNFKVLVEKGYHSGGAGYLMSNEAFKRLGQKLNEDFNYCPNSGTEDVDVGKCFRNLGVYMNASIDEKGRERFHPLNVDGHYYGQFPSWMYEYASNPLKTGVDCCSDSSISYHYMTPGEMLKTKKILDDHKNSSNFTSEKFLQLYLNKIK